MIILPTVDVEGVHGSQPFQQMILGEVGEEETWGVFRQAETFQRHGISATFFVDCYEHTLWGEDKLERVCQTLAGMGQDVQLHTHPSWRDDHRDLPWLRKYKRENSYLSADRDFMAKLAYDEQISVLEEGIDLLEKWLGKKPIAHRSGGYSINTDTIAALAEVGIKIDSSMNSRNVNSKIVWSANRVEQRNGVIEIPITVMRYVLGFLPLIRRLCPYSKVVRTDLDVCSAEDLVSFVNVGERAGLKIMNLMMHSYSLLKRDPLFRHFEPSPKKLDRLDRLLAVLSKDPRVAFMNCESFLSYYQESPEDFAGPDVIPDIASPKTILSRAFWEGKSFVIFWLHCRRL